MTDLEQTRFVVLEGLDGVGTTTQARLVADTLEARGLRVCLTQEPSDGALGTLARAYVRGQVELDPRAAALAFSADRADHLARVIRPALAGGSWVVCDRYLLSTLAYQGADGVDPSWILQLSAAFDVPALTVFLDAPDTLLRGRLDTRTALDRFEAPGRSAGIRNRYRTGIGLLRDRGWRVAEVDGSLPPDAVLRRIMAELDSTS